MKSFVYIQKSALVTLHEQLQHYSVFHTGLNCNLKKKIKKGCLGMRPGHNDFNSEEIRQPITLNSTFSCTVSLKSPLIK